MRNDDNGDATSSASDETPAPWPKVDPESLPKTMMKCKEKTDGQNAAVSTEKKSPTILSLNLSPPSPKSKIEGKSAVTREKTRRSWVRAHG
jgi:hypothetical protein